MREQDKFREQQIVGSVVGQWRRLVGIEAGDGGQVLVYERLMCQAEESRFYHESQYSLSCISQFLDVLVDFLLIKFCAPICLRNVWYNEIQ